MKEAGMGPTDLELGGARAEPAATDAERERMDAALQSGWVFRYDPLRLEFTAAREMHTARKLGELLDVIEASG
jgi:hypothetical protein